MSQNSRQGSKKFKKKWLVFVLICLGATLFHKPLLLLGCKIALYHVIPKQEGRTVSYEKMQWEGDAIVIAGLQVKDSSSEVTIDRIELKLTRSALQFQPTITILHPQILVPSTLGGKAPTAIFLYRHRFIQPRWDIKNGVLQFSTGGRFYFKMLPGDEQESIGHLVFSSDPDPLIPPMFSANLVFSEDNLQVGFKLQESDLSRILPLTGLVIQKIPRKWEQASGEIQLEGFLCLSQAFQLQEFYCQGEGKQIVLASSAIGIDLQCDEIKVALSCPSANKATFLGDKLSTSLLLKNVSCLIDKEFGIKNLEGSLYLEPKREPELTLNGHLVYQEREISFGCVGKGGLMEDATFWSEIELNSISSQKEAMQMILSVCSHEGGDINLHLQVDNADFEHLDFIRAINKIPGHCLAGKARIAATCLYKDEDWHRISVDNCQMENIRWFFPQTQATIFSEKISTDCILVKTSGQIWSVEDMHFQFVEGDYSDPQVHFDSLWTNLAIDHKVLQPSLVKGNWGNLEAEATFSEEKGDYRADVKIQGDGREVITLITDGQSKKFDPLPLDFQVIAKINGSQLNLESVGSISGESIKSSTVFFISNPSLSEIVFGNLPHFFFKETNLQAEHLTEKSYGHFIPWLIPGVALTGELQCEATFLPSSIQLRLNGSKILIQHPLAQLYLPETKKKNIQFVYDGIQKQWHGEIPLDEGIFNYRSNDLSFENLEGSIKLDALLGDPANADWKFKGNFNALKFPINETTSITDGCCDLAFDSKSQEFTIEKAEGIWRLTDGTPLTVQVKRCSSQLSKMEPLDFAFKVIDGKRELAHFEGKATLNDSLQWTIVFDKQKTYLGGTHLNITHCLLDEQMNLTAFEMRPILKCQDLHTQIAFLQNAGFLSKTFSAKNLQDWQFQGTLQTRLYCEGVDKGIWFHAESHDLRMKGKPWHSFQLKAHKIGENWLLEQLKAGGLTLKGVFVVDGSELSVQHFEGKWQDIELKGSGNLKADRKIFSCNFESVKGDLSAFSQLNNSPNLKGNFIAEGFVSGDFSDLYNPLQIVGETNLFIGLQTPLALSGKSKKTIPFTYDQANGLVCNNLSFGFLFQESADIGEIKAEKLLWLQKENLAFEKVEFSLSPKVMRHCVEAEILPAKFKDFRWEGNLEGNGDFQVFSGPVFQVMLKPGRYGFGNKDLPFEQLQICYEKDLLTMRGKTQIEEKPLWGIFQVSLSKEPFGTLKLFDHPKAEGLKILFTTDLSGRVIWESIQGSCYGIDCKLTKNKTRKTPLATVLSGNVKIDCNSLSVLVPQELRKGLASLKIGKGYGWQGDLTLWQEPKRGFQANGMIIGNEFEFLGYQFHSLQGNLEATPEHIYISELKVDDPAGAIGIKRLELNKNEKWHLDIPQVVVCHLQPSLMHKTGGELQVIKPFTIKNFNLSNIHCKLGDKSTLEGSGKLTFINQFKKESSLFDLPFEMIKKIGLDPNLLTPVQGELEVELHGDKFYLMSLKNSFSEGGRAEFYLAPGKEFSYIDLDGKIHIDLKMHQDVMLKITEPFTLTIRGTLEKPRYSLR